MEEKKKKKYNPYWKKNKNKHKNNNKDTKNNNETAELSAEDMASDVPEDELREEIVEKENIRYERPTSEDILEVKALVEEKNNTNNQIKKRTFTESEQNSGSYNVGLKKNNTLWRKYLDNNLWPLSSTYSINDSGFPSSFKINFTISIFAISLCPPTL